MYNLQVEDLDDHTEWATKKKIDGNVNEFYTTVNLPNDLKEFLKKKIKDDKEQDELDQNRKEWNKASRILDRFFAIIMCLTLIIYLSYILNYLTTAGNKYDIKLNLSK